MKKNLNIIFMGTPDFAVPALHALHRSPHHVSLVVTQPDRPKGRGRKFIPTPVKKAAETLGYPVAQPEMTKTDEFYHLIKEKNPDIIVVVAFGHILKKEIIECPIYGVLNIHPSLLPKYRGPAPIQHAIINGDSKTGVAIMQIDEGTDSGDIFLCKEYDISKDDTAGSLHDDLAEKGATLLLEVIENIETMKPVPQDHGKATYASLLKKKDGLIDWNKTSRELDCFIRGMTPWPGAFTYLEGKQYKIFRVEERDTTETAIPGTVLEGFKDELMIRTGDQAVSVLEIQGASGKRLKIKDFLRGHTISPGAVFSREK